MKITAINTYMRKSVGRNVIWVKVDTDEGISGGGECTLRQKEKAVYEAIQSDLAYLMIGKDVFCINDMFHNYYALDAWRSSGGVVNITAFAGVECALWDIIGKALGEPIYNLLGGKKRDGVRVYGGWGMGGSPEKAAETAAATVAKGFTALKGGPFCTPASDPHRVQHGIDMLKAVREAVGWDVDLMVDVHCTDIDTMREYFRKAEPLGLMYIEEPVYPEDIAGYRRLATTVRTPIAHGERVFSRFGFRFENMREIASVVQPDLTHDGGILETKLIGGMTGKKFMKVQPHNSNSILATLQAAHVDITLPNIVFQESQGRAWDENEAFLKTPLKLENGLLMVPDRPGLGVEVNWDNFLSAEYEYIPQKPML